MKNNQQKLLKNKSTVKKVLLAAFFYTFFFTNTSNAAINASRIYQLQQRLIDNPRDIESHLNLAMEYTVSNDLLKSVQAYFALLKVDPQNFHAYNNLGVLYKKSGQYRDSLHCYELAEKINPNSSWVPYNMGLCYEAMGRMQEAREAYGRALSLEPNFKQALTKLRILSDTTGKLPANTENFEEAQLKLSAKPVIVEAKQTKSSSKKVTQVVSKPKLEVKTKDEQMSDKLRKIREKAKANHQHRTKSTTTAGIAFNQAMDALDNNNMEKAIQLYITSVLQDHMLLAEPENGLIKASLQYLKDKPNRIPNGLFYRGTFIFISGNTELAVKDLKAYIASAAKSKDINKDYLAFAKQSVSRYNAEKAAIAAARKAQEEHEALLAAQEQAMSTATEPEQPAPSDYMIQNMSVQQIIDEADRLSRESRVTEALGVIEKGLKTAPNNLDLLMKSANAYTDLLLAKNDKEAGKMAIKRFETVFRMTQENTREWSVAKDMIDELKKRVK